MKKLIYVAEDEKNIRNLIKSFLEKEGYEVQAFENGDLLHDAFLLKNCDLVILDVVMPGSSGFIICTKLREISDVPIIMLTARDTEEDYISGISLGSDDYFTKPFSMVKLTMRIKAMFRRIEMEGKEKPKGVLNYLDITLYPEKFSAFSNDKPLSLTGSEFNLLAYLLENKDRAVSREELLNKLWGYDTIVETRATDDTVKRLRRKLAESGSQIVIDTVWGFGFRVK